MPLDLLLVMRDLVSMALLQILKLLQLLIPEVFVLCGLLLLAERTARLTDGPLEIRIHNSIHNFQPFNFHWPWHSNCALLLPSALKEYWIGCLQFGNNQELKDLRSKVEFCSKSHLQPPCHFSVSHRPCPSLQTSSWLSWRAWGREAVTPPPRAKGETWWNYQGI